MEILIVGDGSFSKNLNKVFKERGHNVIVTSRKPDEKFQLNLSHTPIIKNIPKSDWAIIAAAVTGYKECEENGNAYMVNVTNTIKLAQSLLERGTKVVFPSSTAVFNGKTQFMKCNAPQSPATSYGQQKMEVENYLRSSKNSAMVIRYTKLLEYNSGIIYNWIKALSKGQSITAFTDISFAPVLINDAAVATCSLMEKGKTGLYQCSSPEELSYYDFALKICAEFNFSPDLIKKSHSKSMNISYAPKFSSLDASETETILNWKFPRIRHLIKNLKANNQFHEI